MNRKFHVRADVPNSRYVALLADHTCEVVTETELAVLLKNDSPMREDGDPGAIWALKTDGEFVEETPEAE